MGRGRRDWTKLPAVLAVALVLTGLLSVPAGARSAPTLLSSSVQGFPPSQDEPNGVSCTPRGLCVVVTYGGTVFLVSGTHDVKEIAAGLSLTAVSCPAVTFCAAVGGSSDALVVRPAEVRAYPVTSAGFGSIVHWESVSCPSANFCMAGGGIIQGPHSGAGVVSTWNGHRWSVAKVMDPYLASETHSFIGSLSCTGPTFCVAADGNDRTLQWNGAKWSFPRQLNGPLVNDSFTVSCTSSTFCLALGQSPADVLAWNGRAWSRRSPSHFNTNAYALEISCVTPAFCVAVDDEGEAAAWNGTRWGPAQTVDANNYFNAISCSAAGECEAVGSTDQFVSLHEARRAPTLPVLCASFGCKNTTV
jgi:hypothetical protein